MPQYRAQFLRVTIHASPATFSPEGSRYSLQSKAEEKSIQIAVYRDRLGSDEAEILTKVRVKFKVFLAEWRKDVHPQRILANRIANHQ